jgi:hypothetical protein
MNLRAIAQAGSMTIRAPFKTLYTTGYKANSYEREVFYETLGCCWALSARNVTSDFSIKLLIDLSSVELLYGCPTERLSEELVSTMTHLFQHRPRHPMQAHALLGDSCNALLDGMNVNDFLNFGSGFQDGVRQVLEECEFWCRDCETAYLALKYYGMNLVETDLNSQKHKTTYAALLAEFLLTSQRYCVIERGQKATPFQW